MKRIGYSILFAVILAAVVGIGVFLQMSKKDESKNTVNDIEGIIQEIGELNTSEYIYKITGTCEKPPHQIAGFDIPFTQTKVVYSYEGVIKAGIEFAKIKASVNERGKLISIAIPSAKIMSNELDNSSLTVYDEKYSPFNRATFADFNLTQDTLKKEAEDKALEQGLLDSAQENAKTLIRAAVSKFYDLSEYEIEFR